MLPTLLLGLPCLVILCAVLSVQGLVKIKTAAYTEYLDQSKQDAALQIELQPFRDKIPLLKELVSKNDIETKLGRGVAAAMDRFSPDEIQPTLQDFQTGQSTIGQNLGEGRRLSLKLSSRWGALNAATQQWETRFPNLVLESLSINLEPATTAQAGYLKSVLSYFVITDNNISTK